ncbi:uncharacterized protein PV07_06330 [Cladophialophora immunda]|uniref:Uncharacterized protein n=1 Tax=Cladophialophora immunda TaxID=569365 RepID=A0A0D1ZRE1_9EURO|nr:uncharacterized protein PV07_06330 [Cladophialophora immunda]KIW30596.1 hypothetical protein PV07_06330 [Cladophialophora immunda]OQU99581.1 hypothetical protein CLAIMM_05192 [Cladophialophora immunda]
MACRLLLQGANEKLDKDVNYMLVKNWLDKTMALDILTGYLFSFFQKLLDDELGKLTPTNIFREVLATYRVIFGQHADARNLIRKHCSQGKLFNKYRSPWQKPHPSAFVHNHADPLLERLCFYDCRDETLFVELDMLDLKHNYFLDDDFPCFADRLWALQEYVENQCPNNWKVLWQDRRNVKEFWTIWAVVVFARA